MPASLDLPPTDPDISLAPYDLLKALEANSRFRRDSLLGGIFHLGKTSYREISPTNSLHIVIDGDKVSAHVDDVSPLRLRADGTTRYAWGRVVAHNLLAVSADAARRLRRQHGAQRCDLHCQAEWFDDDGSLDDGGQDDEEVV